MQLPKSLAHPQRPQRTPTDLARWLALPEADLGLQKLNAPRAMRLLVRAVQHRARLGQLDLAGQKRLAGSHF